MSLSENLNSFIGLCKKYQVHDLRYSNLDCTDNKFHDDFVSFTFRLYEILNQAEDDSNIKRAYSLWRSFYYGDSRRAYIFFEYANSLQSEPVNFIWHYKWDAKGRNIDLGHELTCRIFILLGITAQEIHKAGVKNEE